MTGRLRDLTVNRDGTQNITVTVAGDFSTAFDALRDKEVSVEIKKAGKGRSKDANAMCWALCSDIGKAMTPPLSKEDVYRMAIRAVGVYTPVTVIAWDVEKIQHRWEDHGTGWFVGVVDDAGIGRKLIHLYYGSSTYSVDEMRVLIDWLMDQAQQMEIPIPLSKKEEQELLERWGERVTGGRRD
jgi:hypothetical protein